MEPLELVFGALILAVAFWDVFETIVVPRPTPGRFRLSRYLVRGAWRVARGTDGPEVGGTPDRRPTSNSRNPPIGRGSNG